MYDSNVIPFDKDNHWSKHFTHILSECDRLISLFLFSYLAELIFNEVMTRSVWWLISSATRPFQLPFTMPPHAPSATLLRAKSNERSVENFFSRSTQKPEQHLNSVELEFLISSVLLILTETKTFKLRHDAFLSN